MDFETNFVFVQLFLVAKQQISEAKTTIKTSEMDLKHSSTLLRKKQSERQNTDANYVKDKKNAESHEAEIKRLEVSILTKLFSFQNDFQLEL